MNSKNTFYDLDIALVFEALEKVGAEFTGEYFQLNSYENRVFDLFLERPFCGLEHPRVIVKVYRPGRWSREQIEEEHQFLMDLENSEVPVVAPLKIDGESTLVLHEGMWFACFPKSKGRMPQEFMLPDLERVGRQLARLHNVGAQREAQCRKTLTPEDFGWKPLEELERWVAPEVRDRYMQASEDILMFLEEELDSGRYIRIHGDCHRGNILMTDPVDGAKELFFVDFDDFVKGPEVQDFWMLLSGMMKDSLEELESLLKGYEEFRSFDRRQLRWIPALRGVRIIHYAYWIATHWSDPTFPKLFPEFENYIYWAEEVEQLEKIAWSL